MCVVRLRQNPLLLLYSDDSIIRAIAPAAEEAIGALMENSNELHAVRLRVLLRIG